ncbi:tyrosine-type recombinase/integrase [Candidatus Babela massiliensis]|uniref:Site-specific recombinase XerD n=1 Tax=Candidatus Babela massiliensis TaxID=673862 RepID=V6DEZ4_9BACT|nr:tyrosine-type recombinase/integrase [Candidatus Babela massiliensis]CDK30124.1 Site-specific recombinase XerD [Candidatus Babela massiliensis]
MFEVTHKNSLEKISQSISQDFIDDYTNLFLESLDIKQSSKSTYKRQLKEFLVWFKNQNQNNLDRQDLLHYKEFLQNDKSLSSLTISGYLTVVRKFFQWLESVKIYPNIATGIKGPKRRKGFRKDCLTVEQTKILLNSIDRSTLTGKRDFAMLNLMIRTGLRGIEILRANREDISRQSGETVLFIHGKGRDDKDEIVLLTQSVIEPINQYLIARKNVKNRDPIFASHCTKNWGKRLTTRSISRIVKNRLKDINLDDPRLTAHSLRHTAITLSLLAGATTQEVRAMARHSDVNTTLIYAHNINRIKQAPEKKIDAFLED